MTGVDLLPWLSVAVLAGAAGAAFGGLFGYAFGVGRTERPIDAPDAPDAASPTTARGRAARTPAVGAGGTPSSQPRTTLHYGHKVAGYAAVSGVHGSVRPSIVD
ncbi:hypothetical protein [Actinocatenispora thailandica]|uniref:hypothetical protein n=1 Tax=Actinocatenispora thailandica TaxID=227318 RepID=UPI0019505823|nr:hypothetical protein [Actinocatenispora thailandica]